MRTNSMGLPVAWREAAARGPVAACLRIVSRRSGVAALGGALLLAFHPAWPEAPERSASRAGEISVPMDTRGHIPAVEARIDGRGPWRFLLYVREGEHFIDEGVADRLSLRPQPSAPDGMEREGRSRDGARLKSLSLGDLELRELEVRIADMSDFFGGGDVPDGVLSLSAFGDHLVTLDFAGGRLALSDGRLDGQGADTLPTMNHVADDGLGEGKVPVFPVQIGDRRMEMRLGFGAGGELLFPLNDMDRLPLRADPSVIGVARTGDGAYTIQGATLAARVRLGSHTIEAPGARFSEIFGEAQLGSHLMKEYIVTFDPARGLVRFLRGSAGSARTVSSAPEIASLDRGKAPLKEAFNRNRDKVRLVLILSPT